MAQQKKFNISEFAQATGAVLSRYFLAMRAGKMFGGKRDLYEVFGYSRLLKGEDLYGKYQRQDLTFRIVNSPVDATWSTPPKITSDDKFNASWKALLLAQPNLWATLARADRLLAFGRYSTLVVGLPGSASSPARPVKGTDDLLYIQPYGETAAVITELVEDPRDRRFGQPKTYELTTSLSITRSGTAQASSTVQSKATKIRLDGSRVVHLCEALLDDNIYGIPRLEQIYNILDDLLKTSGGAAETFWLIANRGMQVDVDKEMELTAADEAALTDELDEFQHQLRRYIRTRGVEIKPLGADPVDPRGAFSILIQLLAGATGIPQRILLGAEAGQLASEQDRANWAQTMEERRKRFAEPLVLRPLITKLAEMGLISTPTQELVFEWPDAFHMSPLENAQMMAQKARAVINLSRRFQYGDPIITDEEAREICLLPKDGAPPPFGLGVGEPMPVAETEDPEDEADEGEDDQTSKTKDKEQRDQALAEGHQQVLSMLRANVRKGK